MPEHLYSLMAVSAPHWVKKATAESVSLSSKTPFSLQNAVRRTAGLALQGKGHLGSSNWSSKESLRSSVFMMEYWEGEKRNLEEKLKQIKPSLLLIGAMTPSYPGAIEVAKLARELLGDSVFIVIGGKHTNETFFTKPSGEIVNLAGSPLSAMKEGKIPPVFDLVCSGYSEDLIASIAEKIGELKRQGRRLTDIYSELSDMGKTIPGDWRVGWLENGECRGFQSPKIPMEYADMPVPAELFGIQGQFKIYDTELTAHAYSDTSVGCVMDCSFCSERVSMAGKPIDLAHAADRLFKQMQTIQRVAREENGTDSVSVFVEDSILLGGDKRQLHRLAELMRTNDFHINFGGQFTIPNLIDPEIQKALLELREFGFSYVYTGMETADESLAEHMSKNKNRGKTPWLEQNERAVQFLSESKMKYGISLLFGLGETYEVRASQLEQIAAWQREYHLPCVVSANIAGRHPLQESDDDFISWGTAADSAYLALFQEVFGEASEKYAIDSNLPSLSELQRLRDSYRQLELRQELRGETNLMRKKEGLL